MKINLNSKKLFLFLILIPLLSESYAKELILKETAYKLTICTGWKKSCLNLPEYRSTQAHFLDLLSCQRVAENMVEHGMKEGDPKCAECKNLRISKKYGGFWCEW